MDIDRAKEDMRAALKLLPPDALARIGGVLVDHLDGIAAVLPEIIDHLKPHLLSGMLEAGAGMLDMDALEKAWWSLADEFGWKPKIPLLPGKLPAGG